MHAHFGIKIIAISLIIAYSKGRMNSIGLDLRRFSFLCVFFFLIFLSSHLFFDYISGSMGRGDPRYFIGGLHKRSMGRG